jgi:hypothetical protein
MVKGAVSAAKEARIEVDEKRLQRLLNMLHTLILARRLGALCKTIRHKRNNAQSPADD